MKKRKWLLPVCITVGILFLLIIVLIAAAGIMSAKGFGLTIGRLYFSDNSVYLVEDDDMAMLVSDQSRDQDLFSGYTSGDKVLLFHDGVEETFPARTGGYLAFRISKGDGTYKPDDEVLGIFTIDGTQNEHTNSNLQPTLARYSRGYASIFLSILDGWEYETEEQDGGNDFCIAFWPAGQSEGKIKVWHYDAFGVCGTGLEQEKITIGAYEANKGTYDNKKVWDFISLNGTPGQYVVMNEGAEVWWSEYGAEAMQILSTLQVADGIIDEAEAIKIAKQVVTVKYDETYASFDSETGLWTVSFSKKNTLGGNQDVVITHEGKVVENVYGE